MAGTTYTVLLYAVLSSLAQGDQNCQGEDCPATVNSLLQSGKKAIQLHTSSAAVQATTADATQDTYTCRSDRDFINPSSTVSYNQVRQCGSVGCSSGYTTDQKMDLLQKCKDRCTAQSNCVAIAVQYVEMCLLYTGSPTDSDVRGWTHGAQDNNAVCFKENSPWKTAVAISGDGTTTATDIGSTAFNALFAACPVVQYTRNSQVHSVYKRTSPIPDGFDAYSVFTDTWVSTDNTRGTDFNLYSSFDDASADSGAWAFCNYDDPDVAYPRDCGKSGAVGNQWFSMPGGRFNARGVTSGASFEVYQGSDCPVQTTIDFTDHSAVKEAFLGGKLVAHSKITSADATCPDGQTPFWCQNGNPSASTDGYDYCGDNTLCPANVLQHNWAATNQPGDRVDGNCCYCGACLSYQA